MRYLRTGYFTRSATLLARVNLHQCFHSYFAVCNFWVSKHHHTEWDKFQELLRPSGETLVWGPKSSCLTWAYCLQNSWVKSTSLFPLTEVNGYQAFIRIRFQALNKPGIKLKSGSNSDRGFVHIFHEIYISREAHTQMCHYSGEERLSAG